MRQARRLILVILVSAVTLSGIVFPAAAQPGARARVSPPGAYAGRVVELLTDTPLAGAVVVVLWETGLHGKGDVPPPFREALTDAAGEFHIEAPEIVSRPALGLFAPHLLIYKPGYVTYPREPGTHFGVPASRFAGSGRVVALKPAADEEERAEAFNNLFAQTQRFLGTGFDSLLPLAWRLLREELERFAREAEQAERLEEGKP